MKRALAGAAIGVLVAAGAAVPALMSPAAATSAGNASHVSASGTSSPQTGDFTPSGAGDATQAEFPGQLDEADGPGPYTGTISSTAACPRRRGTASRSTAARRPSRTRRSCNGFEGLNLYQQRYARGGNQFTVEPPDQGLCVGNGYVVEAVNDVFNVYNASGQSLLPDNTATNIVGGLPAEREPRRRPELVLRLRARDQPQRPGVRGAVRDRPELPLRRGDAALLPVVLTLETNPERRAHDREPPRHWRSARRANPTGAWNIYRVDVTNDGTNTGGVNPGPYLGDYPHIGADANGFYITTNAYPWCSNGFAGAQIYALLKGAARRRRGERDHGAHRHLRAWSTRQATRVRPQPGFTVWPAQSPGPASSTPATAAPSTS